MIQFKMLDTRYTREALGFIPNSLSEEDDRTAAEQLHVNYAHGGGWHHMKGWSQGPTGEILYEGDRQPLVPIAIATLGTETIRIHENAWVSITQPDGALEVSRMD